MLQRLLDDSYAPEVRNRVTAITVARMVENGAYRYAPPFLATIASGLDVSLATIGLALSITEAGGLISPLLGRLVDNWRRRVALLASGSVVAAGTMLAALADGIVEFTIGLFTLTLAKTIFDLTINAWVADHVPYESRARVIGIVEMSWAGGLLIGVSALGLVTAVAGWRGAYVVAAVAMLAAVGGLAVRLDPEARGHRATAIAAMPPLQPGWWKPLLPVMAAFMCLMGGSQAAFVTFGSWLDDDLGFGPIALAAVTFGLGAGELLASTSTMRLTDHWGKRRSVMYGAGVMVPTGLALTTAAHDHALTGLPLLILFILGFEFAIVSAISLASNLVPGRPGSGIGAMLGAGTMGRVLVAIVATRLYEAHGIAASLLLGACLAAGCVALLATARQLK